VFTGVHSVPAIEIVFKKNRSTNWMLANLKTRVDKNQMETGLK